MPSIPLPKGISGLDEFPKQQEHLINLIWTEAGLVRVPGLKSFATGFGVCRGAVEWKANQKCYQVSGTRFIRVNSGGTITNIGEIPGAADCFFSEGQVNLLIGIRGGDGYLYNETDGLRKITDTDYLPSVSADFIDGRHVLVPLAGGPPFYSEVDSGGAFEPLSFFDAEELPDLNKAAINISNQLFILGGDSSEVFRTNVDPDVVFTRREGSRVDVGFIAALVRYRGTFAFIGRRRGESVRIYAMGSGDAQAISTPAIDELIRKSYTITQIESVDAYRYERNGIEVLCFNFPNHTLTYADGNWTYSSSAVTLSTWRPKGIFNLDGKYVVGDRSGTNIGVFDESAQEYGSDVETEIKTFIRSSRESYFKVRSISADMSAGNSDSETVGLAVSKDGQTFGGFHYRSLGEIGNTKITPKWHPPGGIGTFENMAGLKIVSTSAQKTSLEFLSFE